MIFRKIDKCRRVTLSSDLMRLLGCKVGDEVEFSLNADYEVVIRKVVSNKED